MIMNAGAKTPIAVTMKNTHLILSYDYDNSYSHWHSYDYVYSYSHWYNCDYVYCTA